MVRIVHALLLIAAGSCCGCAASKSDAPTQPDALAAAKAQAVEPAPAKDSVRTTPVPVERTLPEGAVRIELQHANARDVARMLNEIVDASFWAAESRRGCVLRKPPLEFLGVAHAAPEISLPPGVEWRVISRDDPEIARFLEESELQRLRDYLHDGHWSGPFQVAPPPPSFRAWDAHTLVVLEACRDDEYLPRVREFVDRVDVPTREE